uniref:Uncharacterized protein n=1 Tax=Rhodnius prolixus TaxID=13249 RepID=T1I5H1_RHOPR
MGLIHPYDKANSTRKAKKRDRMNCRWMACYNKKDKNLFFSYVSKKFDKTKVIANRTAALKFMIPPGKKEQISSVLIVCRLCQKDLKALFRNSCCKQKWMKTKRK